MNKPTDKNPNEKHRERLRNRYLSGGIDSFSEHEILELILFYSIKRKNTNPIAHELIDKFGSISRVLEQEPQDLVTINGIGPESAVLLNLFSQVFRVYQKSKLNEINNAEINSIDKAVQMAKTLFAGKTNELFYIMNLDPSLKLINCEQISEGTNNETAVYPKKVVKSALRNNACSVIVAHNHPDGKAIPSGKDIASTAKIKNALAAVDIPLNDHIIVSKDGYYSFGQNNML